MSETLIGARAGGVAGAATGLESPILDPSVDGPALAARLDAALGSLTTLEERLIAIADAIPGRITF